MFFVKLTKFIVLTSLMLLIFQTSLGRQRKMSRLAAGMWGGVHIAIQVGSDSASVEYDCANGTINGPLTFDSRGHFSWRGTHTREGPGPIRLGRAPKSLPAIFTGSIRGDTMTLTVKLADTNAVLETFTLKRGSQGRLRKCK